MARLLAAGAAFTAVFAATDEVAFGAISTLRRHGRQTPDDVSVVGFNDVGMAAHIEPPLTTVHVSAKALGLAAWRLLALDRRHAAGVSGESVPGRAGGARLSGAATQ